MIGPRYLVINSASGVTIKPSPEGLPLARAFRVARSGAAWGEDEPLPAADSPDDLVADLWRGSLESEGSPS